MSYLKKTLKTSVCALAVLSVSATSYSKVSPTADLEERGNPLRRVTSVTELESRAFTRLSGRIEILGEVALQDSKTHTEDSYPRILLVQGSETRSDEPTSLFKQFRSYPLVDRAQRLMDRGAFDQAREFLDRAIEQDPNNPRIWRVSALLELRRDNPKVAEEHATRALELDDTNAIARLYRGMARGQLENPEGAKSDLTAALGSKQLTRAEKTMAEKSLESLGFDPAGEEMMVAEAEGEQAEASEEAPDGETGTEENLVARVDELEKSGDYEGAYNALKDAADLDNALVLKRAQNAFRVGKLQDAAKDLSDLTDEDIEGDLRTEAARLLAQVEGQRDNHKKAMAALDIVEASGSLSDEEKSAYVDHAIEAGDEDQAKRHLTDLFESASGAQKGAYAFQLAELHEKAGEPALAQSTLQNLADDEAAETADRIRAWDAIAGFAAEQNDTETVVLAYTKAFELSGDTSYRQKLATVQEEEAAPESEETQTEMTAEAEVEETPDLPTGPTEEEIASAREAADAAQKEMAERLDAAEALAIDGRTKRAITAFEDLAKDDSPLDASQRERLYRSLAQLYEQQEDYPNASANWKRLYGVDRKVETAIEIARTARLAGEYAEARTFLNLIVEDRLSPNLRAVYFDEVSMSFERDSVAAALDPARKAVFAKDAAFRRARVAELLGKLDRHDEAVLELQQALILEPDNASIQSMLGYAYIAADQPAKARAAFERAVNLDPSNSAAQAELARLSDDAVAPEAEPVEEPVVAEVDPVEEPAPLVTEPDVAPVKPPMKLKVEKAVSEEPTKAEPAQVAERTVEDERTEERPPAKHKKDRFFFDSEFVYREGENPSEATLPEAGPSQSFIFAKGGIFLPTPSNWPGMRIAVTGRIFGAFEEDTIDYDGDTTQAGVGIRFIPFAKHDLVLDVERLIEVGDRSRDAWFVTASYNWEHGGVFRDDDLNWNFTAFEGEVAYIPNEPEVATAYAELLQGRMFAFADSFAIYPHGVFAVQFSDDENNSDTTVELGPGIGFRYWFDDPEGHRPTTMDVRVQYRFSLADNRPDDHDGGLVGTVKFEY